jgi:hypothetical protein
MDKLIEQAIKNCKINKYEKYFEQVCKEYKRLLEAESMCEHPWASVMGDGEMKPAKCLKCGQYL